MTNTELLQQWFNEVWVNGNLDAIENILRPDTISTGLIPSFGLRPNDLRALVAALRELLNDIKVTFSHTMEHGDWLAVRTVITAERADTGEPINVTGQLFVRFQDQRIAETHSQFGFFSLFEQLGQLPPDVLPICLTGQTLRWA